MRRTKHIVINVLDVFRLSSLYPRFEDSTSCIKKFLSVGQQTALGEGPEPGDREGV